MTDGVAVCAVGFGSVLQFFVGRGLCCRLDALFQATERLISRNDILFLLILIVKISYRIHLERVEISTLIKRRGVKKLDLMKMEWTTLTSKDIIVKYNWQKREVMTPFVITIVNYMD